MHINRKLLWAVRDGTLPPRVLYEIGKAHLEAICPICEEEIQAFEEELLLLAGSSPDSYGEAIERVHQKIGKKVMRLEAEEKRARGWIDELLALPPEERRGKVQRAHTRFRGKVFCELVLEEARCCIPDDPWQCHSLADMALVSCYESDRFDPDPELLVQAVALRGNAKRALGHLSEAEADLRYARRLVNEAEITETLICAEIDRFEGSLRHDQRRLDDAAKLLHRAATLYRLLGEHEAVARILIKLATVHYQLRQFDGGLQSVEKALELLGPGSQRRLLASAHFNRAILLHALGEYGESEEVLDEQRDLLAEAGEGLAMRITWLRAKLAWSREDLALSEKLYKETRRQALSRGIAYDTASIALELALVYLTQGRNDLVKKLASEAVEVFAREDVHQEVFTALKLVEAAAKREKATRQMIEKTLAFLEEARLEAGRGLEKPS